MVRTESRTHLGNRCVNKICWNKERVGKKGLGGICENENKIS